MRLDAFGQLLGGLVLLSGSGCFYGFDNPIEQRPLGAVTGRVVLQAAAPGETPAGGLVQVLWTPGLQLSLPASGRFLFTDLPDGVYALQFAAPPLDAGLVGEVSGLVLPRVDQGPDALNVGDLRLAVGGFVAGTVSGSVGATTVSAFASGDGGLGRYEAFAADLVDGGYALTLPVGRHLLAATDSEGNSALAPVEVVPLSSQMVSFDLTPPDGGAALVGRLVLGGDGRGAGSSLAEVGPLLSQVSFIARDEQGQVVAQGPFGDGTGSFTLPLPLGGPVTVSLQPPSVASPDPCDVFPPLALSALPRVSGQATQLGQVTWLTNRELAENGLGPCVPDGGGGSTTTGSGTGSTSTSGGGSTGGTGGGSTGGGSSTGSPPCGSTTGGEGPLRSPLLVQGDGGVLASPMVVLITYPGDNNSELLSGDVLWLTGYLPTHLAEYGIGTIRNTGVAFNDAPPDSFANAPAYLQGHYNDGSLPAAGPDSVDLLEIPAAQAAAFCNASGEYNHFAFSDADGGLHAFAVVADCTDGGNLGRVEQLTSQILAQAMTDPFGGGWRITDPSNPYSYNGGEISDLCAASSYAFTDAQSGFVAGLLWSNAQAADGGVPCQPWPPSADAPPYLALNVTPASTQTVQPGQAVTFTLSGWASACYPPFTLDTSRATSTSSATAQATFNPSLGAGQSESFVMTLSPNAQAGQVATEWILCRDNEGGYVGSAVLAVQAQ